MQVNFAAPESAFDAEIIAAPAFKDAEFEGAAAELDERTSGALAKAAAYARFSGEAGSIARILAPAGLDVREILLIGLGPKEECGALEVEAFGGHALGAVRTSGAKSLALATQGFATDKLDEGEFAARAALGARLRGYTFERYRTTLKDEEKTSVATVTAATGASDAARGAFEAFAAVAEGVFFTRDLCSEPANILFPEEFARRCEELKSLGVKVEVLGEKEMEKLGMGSLLAVGQGSVRESKLCVMRWEGAKGAPIAFVGKGVCFDTGGISIKPAGGMEDMKWDMGGAGAVAGAMKAIAGRKAKAHVIGILGLVENMPDGNAIRPGDVVTSMSGKTIEILNTDAEGRLVLADALTYVQRKYEPRLIVDLATLTGAILVSLAHEYAGMFSNDDDLAKRLQTAGARVDEKLWRLPLGKAYDKQLESPIADMKNIGGRWGGSITAAQFLQRFIENDTPWAHLDVAGVVWNDEKDKPTAAKGATGYGARLLDRFVADNYED